MTWISGKLKSAGYRTHWFGKWHTGFRSMAHLGQSRGFDSTVGSLQTGGAYSGPKHTTRWQDAHPLYRDAQFSNMPPHCNQYPGPDAATPPAVCGPAEWLNGTEMQCGSRIKYTAAATPAACCADCAATAGCSHWVHNGQGPEACHVKAGTDGCRSAKPGDVSGRMPPAPPPPPGAAECTDEYSTDLWGQSAVQAVAQHNTTGPLYVHLCFEVRLRRAARRAAPGPTQLRRRPCTRRTTAPRETPRASSTVGCCGARMCTSASLSRCSRKRPCTTIL